MVPGEEIAAFIRSSFRSVWSLELLLLLKREPERSWSRADLVAQLRASDLVVDQGVDVLHAAGLVLTDASGAVCYRPLSDDLAAMVEQAEALYARSPNAVRRVITAPATRGLAAFADAFRLRR